MGIWSTELSRGRFYLKKHNPHNALKCFKRALSKCPVSAQKDLSSLLFYLGFTFQRLGLPENALNTWRIGSKLEKKGYTVKVYKRFANEYGMIKQAHRDMDDWHAFYSLQYSKYLKSKSREVVKSLPEQDMIKDLLWSVFLDIMKSGYLEGKSTEEKTLYFKNFNVVFPVLFQDVEGQSGVIPVNFLQKKKISYQNSCICGSRLPYVICCGSIADNNKTHSGLL